MTSVAQRRRAETRAEILESAWELCRANGLAGLSLRELAKNVGMAPASLYSYFDSKDAIYDAMFREGYEELRALIRQSPDPSPPGGRDHGDESRDALAHQARQFFEFCVADPVRYQLLFQRTIPGFEPSEESYAIAVDMLDDARARLRAAGFEDDELLDLWTAVLTGLTDQQISNDPGGDRWGRLVDRAVDMFATFAERGTTSP